MCFVEVEDWSQFVQSFGSYWIGGVLLGFENVSEELIGCWDVYVVYGFGVFGRYVEVCDVFEVV